jgi:hypothetical protein
VVAHYLEEVAVTYKVSANTLQANGVAGNSAYTAQVAAGQSTRVGVALVATQAVAARAVAARAGTHGIAQHLSKAVVADKRWADSRFTSTALEEALAHYLEQVAVTDEGSANTRQVDEVAVDEVAVNSAHVYTAQVVAAQSAVDGVFPPVAPLALQPETPSQADAVDEAVVTVVAATHAERKAEANSVGDQFKNQFKNKFIDAVNTTDAVDEAVVTVVAAMHAEHKAEANSVGDQFKNQFENKFIDAVNTAKVDAQCESAKDVLSNEEEAKVEHVHVEEKGVATDRLAPGSTAQVLGKPEQHTCGDQSLDLNADGAQIAWQLEIWATRRRPIVLSEAKSLQKADAKACMEALEDPDAAGVVFSPSMPMGTPDNHPESDYLMALGEEVSNNRHISGRIAGLAMAIAFFLFRIGEFAARYKRHMDDSILLRQDVTFFCQGQRCAWHQPMVDTVEVFIRGCITDQHKKGGRRMQYLSGDATLCPINCMVEWFALTGGSHIPASAPLFSVPKGQEGVEWSVLTREAVTYM